MGHPVDSTDPKCEEANQACCGSIDEVGHIFIHGLIYIGPFSILLRGFKHSQSRTTLFYPPKERTLKALPR